MVNKKVERYRVYIQGKVRGRARTMGWELCRGMYVINGCPDAGCTPLHVSKPLGRRCVRPFPKGILNTDERARRYARCVVD